MPLFFCRRIHPQYNHAYSLFVCAFFNCIIGDVDRDEWRETIEFYLELKEEEMEMANHDSRSNSREMAKKMREKRLQQLGVSLANIATTNEETTRKMREKKLKELGVSVNKLAPNNEAIAEEEDESHHGSSEKIFKDSMIREVVIEEAVVPDKPSGDNSDEDAGMFF